MQPLLKTEFGEGKKQYCLHGPYHLICPKINSDDFEIIFHISVFPVSPTLSNSIYLLMINLSDNDIAHW